MYLSTPLKKAAKLEEIMECYHMAGAIDFLLRVAIDNMEEYNSVLVKNWATCRVLGNSKAFSCYRKLNAKPLLC